MRGPPPGHLETAASQEPDRFEGVRGSPLRLGERGSGRGGYGGAGADWRGRDGPGPGPGGPSSDWRPHDTWGPEADQPGEEETEEEYVRRLHAYLLSVYPRSVSAAGLRRWVWMWEGTVGPPR